MKDTARTHQETHYPESDEMGESMLQRLIAELLRPLLERFLRERGTRAFVGADQFLYWVEGDATQRVAPDVYVIPGEAPEAIPRSWLLWKHPRGPSFALEVVGRDVLKDYEDAPNEYKKLGVDELVIFDPEAFDHPRSERTRWQVWRTVKRRGFVRVLSTNGDRVESAALGCWLRAVGDGPSLRVRLAVGAHGDDLVETDAERSSRERAEKERERAERIALQEELARLRAERDRG
jgi:hypothetical protein